MINRVEEDGEYVVCFNGEIRCIKHGEAPFNITLPQGLEIMQFTGLHDKNGKEIYEGDIVRAIKTNRKGINIQGHPGSQWDEPCNEEYKFEVVFDGLEFRWSYEARLSEIQLKYVGDEKHLDFLERTVEHMVGSDKDRFENFEVIGNIYENGSLLNK